MSIYMNPPERAREVGRSITAGVDSYEDLLDNLDEDEVPVGFFKRTDMPHDNAPFLLSFRVWNGFQQQIGDSVIKIGYYAIKKEEAKEHTADSVIEDWNKEEAVDPNPHPDPRQV